MLDINGLERRVKELYEAEDPNRDERTDTLWQSHVQPVADFASELAERFGADPDLSRAVALLHDIADVRMSRFAENHEEASLQMAHDLLAEFGATPGQVDQMVNDALRYHSCHGDERPQSLEGKVLATADALAHIHTEFYPEMMEWLRHRWDSEQIKHWAQPKLERDFNTKIFFEEVREEVRPRYESLKSQFEHWS